jgi:hypothetical protein
MYKPKDMFVDLFDLVKALKEKSSLTIFLWRKYDLVLKNEGENLNIMKKALKLKDCKTCSLVCKVRKIYIITWKFFFGNDSQKWKKTCQDLQWFSSMRLNQVKVFKMLDQNNVTFQGFKFSFNNENAIHRCDQ